MYPVDHSEHHAKRNNDLLIKIMAASAPRRKQARQECSDDAEQRKETIESCTKLRQSGNRDRSIEATDICRTSKNPKNLV